MTNVFVAYHGPPNYHAVWQQDLIKSMSPITSEGKHRGIDIAETRLYQIRVYQEDTNALLSRIKTYNNMDHENAPGFRPWIPHINRIAHFIRGLVGLGNVPITIPNPINTPGHCIIVGISKDKIGKDGREMR